MCQKNPEACSNWPDCDYRIPGRSFWRHCDDYDAARQICRGKPMPSSGPVRGDTECLYCIRRKAMQQQEMKKQLSTQAPKESISQRMSPVELEDTHKKSKPHVQQGQKPGAMRRGSMPDIMQGQDLVTNPKGSIQHSLEGQKPAPIFKEEMPKKPKEVKFQELRRPSMSSKVQEPKSQEISGSSSELAMKCKWCSKPINRGQKKLADEEKYFRKKKLIVGEDVLPRELSNACTECRWKEKKVLDSKERQPALERELEVKKSAWEREARQREAQEQKKMEARAKISKFTGFLKIKKPS